MYMKYLNKYILVIFISLALGGCRDSFFNQYPLDSFNEGSFYKKAGDFEQGLNAAYSSLRGVYNNWYVFGDIASDDAYDWKFNNNVDLITINQSEATSTNGQVSNLWNTGYNTIALANIIISRSAVVTYDDARKSRYVGEAKFIRALIYFDLVQVFGGVPLVIVEMKDPAESYNFSRETVDNVYAQIISDLKAAETSLPNAYTANSDIGRATNLAAKSLLAKVYLTQKKYTEAITKLNEVIVSTKYSLLPNYNNIFDPNKPTNSEIIFAIQYARGFDPVQGSPFGNYVAPNTPVDKIVVVGGAGAGFFHMTKDLANAFEIGDLRKTSMDSAIGSTRKFYYTKKYFDPLMAKSYDAANDWIVMRYADILLMMAECQTKTGNPGAALPFLNQVRTRAGLSSSSTTDPGKLTFEIEKERRIELYNEGHRWFDLVRTGRCKDVMNASFLKYAGDLDEVGSNSSVSDYELLFPLPKFQVDLNPDKLKQNPGY